MKRRKPKLDYRIVGGQGEWFAWRPGFHLRGWFPHVGRISHRLDTEMAGVTAVMGRTPFEALERLKKIERLAC